MNRIVILGAGHAGCQLAFALRACGYQGEISLVNGEDALPYHRPPLSKAFLKSGRADELLLRGERAFVENRIQLCRNTAQVINRTRREVTMADGMSLPYDHLVLATGTVNRRLQVPSGDQGVFYLKNVSDAEALRAALPRAQRVAIIGAGFIGLEFAAFAAGAGKSVSVIDLADRAMARTASHEISAFFERRHFQAGVQFRFSRKIVDVVRKDGAAWGLLLDGEDLVEADLIVAGIGVIANSDLAEASGLETENGIVVDRYLTTSDHFISAIGDCARFPTSYAPNRVRLESVQNANDQARSVAEKLTGNKCPYTAVPWFWSDQGSDKLQIAGLTGATDHRVTRGLPDENKFSVFSFREDRLIAVESVNQPADHMLARRLIAAGTQVDPARAADANFQLKTLIC
ncbi:FAD-dependent oxidoreductase [Mesorhizobium sp. M0047]|uniref:NAD(P)/FAD-dependent oxidoreductase n=1 Tax=Mesorhizobium sp. M0047 TaxID=2956859 RepID=UPI003336DC65